MPTDPALEICRRLEELAKQIHVVQEPEDKTLLEQALLEFRRNVMALVRGVDATDVIVVVHSPEEAIQACIADLMEHGSRWKAHQLESLEQIGVAAEELLFGAERIRGGASADDVDDADGDRGARFSGVWKKGD